MTTIDLIKIKEEILNLIRNGNVLTIAQRNVTTVTENLVGSVGSIITLSNEGVKNIRSLKISTVLQTVYVDYDINIITKTAVESKVIDLTTALTGGEAIEVIYDYSPDSKKEDRIYADFPEDFLTVSSFPRIGFEIDSIVSTSRSTNDTLIQENILINFITITTAKLVDSLEKSVYDIIFNNRKSMNNNNLMRPSGRSSKDPYKKFNTTILYHKMFSFKLPAEFSK